MSKNDRILSVLISAMLIYQVTIAIQDYYSYPVTTWVQTGENLSKLHPSRRKVVFFEGSLQGSLGNSHLKVQGSDAICFEFGKAI